MSPHFAIALHPIEMSQKFLNLSLRFFVLVTVFFAESGSSLFNITRYTTGDVFHNANSSKTCIDSGAACLLKVEDSPFCGKNCCNCVCRSETPTYLLRNGSCSSEDHLMSILKAQSQIQGCDHRMVVAEKHLQCTNEVLTTLDTKNPGKKSLYLCSWNADPTSSQVMIHFQLVRNLQKCEIVPEESLFLVNGSWKNRSPHDSVFSELNVEIGPDPAVYSDKLYLKWNADIGRQYDGLIFSLKLRCRGKQGKNLTSCVHFKKAGSFTDIKPTPKPGSLISTRARTTFVQPTTAKAVTATTLTSTETPTPSTTHVSSSVVLGDVGATSFADQPQRNIVPFILAALAGALFVLLACLAVIFLLWRRTRNFKVKKEADNATNPIYERGASDTLKMSKIPNGNGQGEEEWPEYQPLVENTKPRERTDSLPGYRLLSIGQKPANDQPPSNEGVRSSNYLSLIQDDPEENRMYQTLTKDANSQANSQKLEMVDEANIPDYAELEERSDSEDSFESSDSKDYEEPPAEECLRKPKPCSPVKRKLNDLSSAFRDYDEPEGIIVISDDENDLHKKAIKDGNDFHDYADPDDTDEDNVNCNVTPKEDLSCYHDYDDPE